MLLTLTLLLFVWFGCTAYAVLAVPDSRVLSPVEHSFVSYHHISREMLSWTMATTVEPRTLLVEQLHQSVCLLRLLAEHPPNIEELFPDHEESALMENTFSDADNVENSPEGDLGDLEDINPEGINETDPKVLRNKVLDRLAEILAKYKTDRKVKRGPLLDPKYVSSTMMMVDEEHEKVKILCAKNEGLNQNNSTDDTDFLDDWKTCMERIARQSKFVYSQH